MSTAKLFVVTVLAVGVLSFGGAKLYHAIDRPDMEQVQRACVAWLSGDYNDGNPARALDSWRRRGRVVVQIGLVTPGDSMMTSVLCVYDPSTERLMKPSVFDTRWHR